MKKCIFLVLFAAGFLTPTIVTAQKAGDQKAKTDMLKAFYTEYIAANTKDPVSEKEVQGILKKYLTVKFLKEVPKLSEELESDPFVSAQDFDAEWLKTLTIEPSATFNVFRVSYDMGFEDEKALIRPVVAKEGGKYKIDGIKTD